MRIPGEMIRANASVRAKPVVRAIYRYPDQSRISLECLQKLVRLCSGVSGALLSRWLETAQRATVAADPMWLPLLG